MYLYVVANVESVAHGLPAQQIHCRLCLAAVLALNSWVKQSHDVHNPCHALAVVEIGLCVHHTSLNRLSISLAILQSYQSHKSIPPIQQIHPIEEIQQIHPILVHNVCTANLTNPVSQTCHPQHFNRCSAH